MIYTCAKCGQSFWGKDKRVKYYAISPYNLNSIDNIMACLFEEYWYLCDICTKETGIETLFKENKS